MTWQLRLRPQVVDDLSGAADWYDRERHGLGQEFLASAYLGFDVILERPLSFPIVSKGCRRALMKRFPYAIYFRVEHDVVVILVVIHTARSPRAWKRRVR